MKDKFHEGPHGPHHPNHHPMPPHMRHSRIHLDYNDDAILRLREINDDVDYLKDLIDTSPPEIKLLYAIELGIKIDISCYSQEEVHPIIRFATPILTEENIELIANAINSHDLETIAKILNSCPPEQTLLAIIAAQEQKKKSEEKTETPPSEEGDKNEH